MTSLSMYDLVKEDLQEVQETLRRTSALDDFEQLSQLLDHVVGFTGKQVRPAITLLASKFYPEDPAPPILMASAIELLHIATLVHDDTIDNAATRRGRPTVSEVWGRDVAVLLGDYTFAKSATYVCDTGNVQVIRLFAETIMALSSGELQEYLAAYDWQQSRDAYLKRIGDKTASLFTTAGETGAALSAAPEKHVAAMHVFGFNLGMAFQVVDDILDFEGTEEVVGKPVGSDLSQGVMTLPAILYADQYPDDGCIKALFADRENGDLLKEAIDRIRGSQAMEMARAVAEGYLDKSREALSALPDHPARRSLLELSEYVVKRQL